MLQKVPSNNAPYADLPSICTALFQAKASKGEMNADNPSKISSTYSKRLGLTFDDIAKAIGRDEVWVAAAFYGQVWSE